MSGAVVRSSVGAAFSSGVLGAFRAASMSVALSSMSPARRRPAMARLVRCRRWNHEERAIREGGDGGATRSRARIAIRAFARAAIGAMARDCGCREPVLAAIRRLRGQAADREMLATRYRTAFPVRRENAAESASG